MSLIIRKSEKDEVGRIADLLQALNDHEGYDYRPDPSALEDAWENFDTYVAESDEILIGVLCGSETFVPHNGTSWYEIQSLFVKESFRRQGAGEKLIHHVIQDKHSEGMKAFIINVRQKNKLGNDFYKSLGMQDKPLDHHRYFLHPDHIDNFIKKTA